MYIGFRVVVISMYLTFYLTFCSVLFIKGNLTNTLNSIITTNKYNPAYLVFCQPSSPSYVYSLLSHSLFWGTCQFLAIIITL